MHTLLTALGERIAAGLVRKSITTCARWAEQYRIMGQPYPGPWSFKHHPWCREMHDCEVDMVGQKGAQLGFTETALNKVFFTIDVYGGNVLYVLPASTPDATDFSTSRFDPALEASGHLRSMFSDVKNIGHKRAGQANLFIRGSRSRSQLKSIPAGLLIFDEVDEMVQKNITLAFERASGQVRKQRFLLSTPTIEGSGINAYYLDSTQARYFFKCPSCSKWTQCTFPDSLVITSDDFNDPKIKDSHLICQECKAILPHEDKVNWLASGKWVESKRDMPYKGYHVSQLYSMQMSPPEMAVKYLKAMTNVADEQEFFNSQLGLPHTVDGAKITDEDITSCIGGYVMVDRSTKGFHTLGVDVGKFLHFEIIEWRIPDHKPSPDINLIARPRVLKVGKVREFSALHNIMNHYKIGSAVIDAQPERRKAFEFAEIYGGRVKLCFYGRGISSRMINLHSDTDHTVTVDRTSWLDLSLGRFFNQTVLLPKDLPMEYREHIKAVVRVHKKDSDGNPVGKYVKNDNDADHYVHAHTYAEIALPLGLSLGRSQNIRRSP